jgi:hypothetical protein
MCTTIVHDCLNIWINLRLPWFTSRLPLTSTLQVHHHLIAGLHQVLNFLDACWPSHGTWATFLLATYLMHCLWILWQFFCKRMLYTCFFLLRVIKFHILISTGIGDLSGCSLLDLSVFSCTQGVCVSVKTSIRWQTIIAMLPAVERIIWLVGFDGPN